MNERFNLMSALGILRLAMRGPGITTQGVQILAHAEQYLRVQEKSLTTSHERIYSNVQVSK